MADAIQVVADDPIQLRLLIGGAFPYKWKLYEYPDKPGAPPQPVPGGEGEGYSSVSVGTAAAGKTRKFVWSAAIVDDDEEDSRVVNVKGEVLNNNNTEVGAEGTLKVIKPYCTCFVHVWVKGVVR